MANNKIFYFKSVDLFPLPTLWDHNKVIFFYKCDLFPNLTHLELQTAEFGQNLAKRAKNLV